MKVAVYTGQLDLIGKSRIAMMEMPSPRHRIVMAQDGDGTGMVMAQGW